VIFAKAREFGGSPSWASARHAGGREYGGRCAAAVLELGPRVDAGAGSQVYRSEGIAVAEQTAAGPRPRRSRTLRSLRCYFRRFEVGPIIPSALRIGAGVWRSWEASVPRGSYGRVVRCRAPGMAV